MVEYKLIISFDGGGMRGLVTLYLLDYLEKEFGVDITLKAHLMGGTSTGGIIALSKIQRLSNQEIKDCYLNVGKTVMKFSCDNIVEAQTLANTQLYEQELALKFKNTKMLELGDYRKQRALVVCGSKPTGSFNKFDVTLLCNYPTISDKRKYLPKDRPIDVTVVDAIRCTSGIPLIFGPIKCIANMDVVDGGVLHNNPVNVCINEAISEWKSDNVEYIVISLGTGRAEKYKSPVLEQLKKSTVRSLKGSSQIGVSNSSEQLTLGVQVIDQLLEGTSGAHSEYLKFVDTVSKQSTFTIHPFRLDPQLQKSYFLADASDETIKAMKTDTDNYLTNPTTIETISKLKLLLHQSGFIP
ncbi:patatin family protein [Cavenderia fasciculata]|uniref:Patatin family protein n=1 Tax=Cavenderia fasciculata TaxID=261658 RepID=F4QFR2_CACFS|nr:patatin family protein [Cavenderia fasciculata]EGG14309.1 patatin family protein [Cavenderia fasciculata]|eukprot:XP_004351018.1 patatin family protein [Cavenderia fasciculata]